MKEHLAIYSRKRSQDYIELMLNGEKTKDIKLSTKRIAPYNKLEKGDRVYIKESGGPVVGSIKIGEVQYHEFKDPYQLEDLLKQIWKSVGLLTINHAIKMAEKMGYMRYGTVFEIEDPVKMPPLTVFKRDRRVWVPDWEPPFDLLPFVDKCREEQLNKLELDEHKKKQ